MSYVAHATGLILWIKGEGIALVLHEGADGGTHRARPRSWGLFLQIKHTPPGPGLELSRQENIFRFRFEEKIYDMEGFLS